MWPRVVEVMLGCWLLISPFVFRLPPGETFLWANSFAAGAVVIAISLAACKPSWERVRFLNLAVCAYLVLSAYFAPPGPWPPPPAYQSWLVVALLILITAVIPTQSTRPPRAWQAFYENRKAG